VIGPFGRSNKQDNRKTSRGFRGCDADHTKELNECFCQSMGVSASHSLNPRALFLLHPITDGPIARFFPS
jgi:hypothetical protein